MNYNPFKDPSQFGPITDVYYQSAGAYHPLSDVYYSDPADPSIVHPASDLRYYDPLTDTYVPMYGLLYMKPEGSLPSTTEWHEIWNLYFENYGTFTFESFWNLCIWDDANGMCNGIPAGSLMILNEADS